MKFNPIHCIWLLTLIAGAFPAFGKAICYVCSNPAGKQVYVFNDVAHGQKWYVCEACAKIELRCYSCGIPLKSDFRQLDDGRAICRTDLPNAVFDERRAQDLFDDVCRDMFRLFSGYEPIPYRNLRLKLVDEILSGPSKAGLDSAHDSWVHLGLTRSRQKPGAGWTHDIYIAKGLSPGRFASVAAHEFAHAWMFENVPATRKINPDTVEAFCELVAHKLMVERNLEFEKRGVERNLYTKGQIHTLIKAESELRFHRLLDWIRTGVDERILADDVSGTVRLKTNEFAGPVFFPVIETPPPAELKLKAITGAKGQKLALVNSTPMAVNEKARMPLGASNIWVRCVEIRARSVLIQTGENGDTQELFLGN